MRKLEYHPRNFAEARGILVSSNTMPANSVPRIFFNEDTVRFEIYDPQETPDPHAKLSSVVEAIEAWENAKAIKVMEPSVEKIVEEAAKPLPVSLPNDETEVVDAARNNLKVIEEVAGQTNEIMKEKLLNILGEFYKLDLVSTSDIMQALVEHAELKRLLSLMLDRAGVKISVTEVNRTLQVNSKTIVFSEKLEYGLEHYRLGASEALSKISQVGDLQRRVSELEEENARLTTNLGSTSRDVRNLSEKNSSLSEQLIQERTKSDLPVYYLIQYKDKYVKVVKDIKTKPTEKGDYLLKYLELADTIAGAKKFGEEAVKAQMQRIFKHKNNINFADLKNVGEKQMLDSFTVFKVQTKAEDLNF